LCASATSEADRGGKRRTRRGLDPGAASEIPIVMAEPAGVPAGLGTGSRKVSERRRLVFLSLLAAEISVRRARLRHKTGRIFRLDSVRRLWPGQFARRLVFEPVAAARKFAEPVAQTCARGQRRRYAVDSFRHAGPGRVDDRAL